MDSDEAAVAAAARVIALDTGWVAEDWDAEQIPAKYRRRAFETAIGVLEAAAPILMAQAWEAGRDAEFQRSVLKQQIGPNPYRTTP